MSDEDRIAALLEQARQIADWNYRLDKRVGAPDRGDRWSATLGHIEYAQQRFPAPATPSQRLDAATVERCAQVAETVPLDGVLTPGWPDGAASASRQIATAIRTLATEPHQHGRKGA